MTKSTRDKDKYDKVLGTLVVLKSKTAKVRLLGGKACGELKEYALKNLTLQPTGDRAAETEESEARAWLVGFVANLR